MKTRTTNHASRNTFCAVAYLVMFIVAFFIGCESPAPVETGPQVIEPTAPAEAEARVVEEKAEAQAEAAEEEAEAKAAEEKAEAVEPKAPAEVVTEPDKTGIAVTVNGIDITESEVEARIKPRLDRLTAQGGKIPPAFTQRLKRQALDDMIVELLLEEKIKEANIIVTEEDIIAYLEKSGSAQTPPLSLEDIKELIESRGQSFDEVKQNIRKGLSYQKFMESQGADEINVTEDDAQKYYSENPRRFEIPEQVRASHILIKPDTSDPNTDPNEAKAQALTEAQDLLRQIRDGADFAGLAKASSACSSAARGGDLGLKARGAWVKPFEEAAFGLEIGQVSDVVETRFGYHIIKVTGHEDPNTVTFEQAKDSILTMLTQMKQREFTMQYIESLRADADIVYPPGKEPKAVPTRP